MIFFFFFYFTHSSNSLKKSKILNKIRSSMAHRIQWPNIWLFSYYIIWFSVRLLFKRLNRVCRISFRLSAMCAKWICKEQKEKSINIPRAHFVLHMDEGLGVCVWCMIIWFEICETSAMRFAGSLSSQRQISLICRLPVIDMRSTSQRIASM